MHNMNKQISRKRGCRKRFATACIFRFIHLLSKLALRHISQIRESLCVIDCHISQNFAVQLDTAELKAIHEFAVRKSVQSCSSIDTCNPKLSELTLSLLSSFIGRCKSSHYRLLCNTILLGAGTAVTLRKL